MKYRIHTDMISNHLLLDNTVFRIVQKSVSEDSKQVHNPMELHMITGYNGWAL